MSDQLLKFSHQTTVIYLWCKTATKPKLGIDFYRCCYPRAFQPSEVEAWLDVYLFD